MLGIFPSIIQHEINNYENVKLVHQWVRLVNPRKVVAIKAEVEKLLKAGFSGPIPFTDWILNIVLVDKKKVTIWVCVKFRDINKACPKDNFATPLIDQIIDDCFGNKIFSLIERFSRYNQITIDLEEKHKTNFICP